MYLNSENRTILELSCNLYDTITSRNCVVLEDSKGNLITIKQYVSPYVYYGDDYSELIYSAGMYGRWESLPIQTLKVFKNGTFNIFTSEEEAKEYVKQRHFIFSTMEELVNDSENLTGYEEGIA